MPCAANENDKSADTELDQLRELLFRREIAGLEQLRLEVAEVKDQSVERERLVDETAQILAAAIKKAEIRSPEKLAAAMAPLVLSGIRNEIKNSKEMMVEALYPITGRLVSASVTAAVRDAMEAVNQRIEKLTSVDGLVLTAKSKLSGRAPHEFMVAASSSVKVYRILLIERGTGLLLQSWQYGTQGEEKLHLLSGLVAAMTEFAASATADDAELKALDMGSSRLFLRSSAQCVIAIELNGNPGPAAEKTIGESLFTLIGLREHGQDISPDQLAEIAERIESPKAAGSSQKKKSNPARYILMGMLGISVWLMGTAAFKYWQESRLNSAFRAAVSAESSISGFPLQMNIDHDTSTVTVMGMAPAPGAPDRIINALRLAAPSFKIEPKIAIVSSLEALAERSAALDRIFVERLEGTRTGLANEQSRSMAGVLQALESQKMALSLSQDQAIDDIKARLVRLQNQETSRSASLQDSLAEIDKRLAIQTELGSQHTRQILALEDIQNAPRASLDREINVRSFHYAVGVSDITQQNDLAFLDTVAQRMKGNTLRLEIRSVVDLPMARPVNMQLATLRLEFVADALVARGVPRARLILSIEFPNATSAAFATRRVYLRVADNNDPR